MLPFHSNIQTDTLNNQNYRQVLYTGPQMQLVVMTLKPGQEIGTETHDEHDQFIRVEEGSGLAIIDNQEYQLSDDIAIIIPAGSEHNIINTHPEALMRLYTIYAPPEHPDGTIQVEKP